jgi:hypothetical protein
MSTTMMSPLRSMRRRAIGVTAERIEQCAPGSNGYRDWPDDQATCGGKDTEWLLRRARMMR